MDFEAEGDDHQLHLSQKWVVNLKGCKTWVPKQKEVNDGTFLALSKWDRQCILALTDRALDLRANKDGGSLNSEVWDELIAARQEVADRAIEEALKTDDADENGPKKKQSNEGLFQTRFHGPAYPHGELQRTCLPGPV